MAEPVTDPEILRQLNAPQPVTDPATLKALNAPLRSFGELGQAMKSGARFSQLSKDEQDVVARGERGPVDDKVRGLARGVPFVGTFSDEINARLNAATAGLLGGSQAPSYDQRVEDNLAYERAKDRTFDQDQPWTSVGARVVGGIAGTVAAAPAAAATGAVNAAGRLALGTGAKSLPGAVARGAVAGGMQGAAAGAGDAEEGFVDRAKGAVEGGVLGTAFGAGAPVAVAGLGKAVSAARSLSPSAAAESGPLDGLSRPARNYVRDALAAPDLVQRQQGELGRLGEQAMLADVSPEWMMIARGAAARPGSREEVVAPLLARNDAKNARIRSDLDTSLGPAPVPSQVEAGLERSRAALSPDYTAALRDAQPVDTMPIAQALQGEVRLARGREWTSALNEVLDLIAPRVQTPQGAQRVLETSAEGLLNSRGAVDTIIRRMEAAAETDPKALRSVSFLRQAIDDELASKVPGLKAVDGRYADLASQSEALKRGSRVFASGKEAVRPVELADELAGLSGGERNALQQGTRGELDRLIGTQANDPLALKRAVQGEGDWNRDKMRMIFGEDPSNRVLNAIDREATFANTTNRVTAGSDTAAGSGFAEATKRLEGGRLNLPNDTSVIGLTASAVRTITKGLMSDLGIARAHQFASELGRAATLQGPARDQFVNALVREGVSRQKAQNLMEFAARVGTVAGREAPSLLLPRGTGPQSQTP